MKIRTSVLLAAASIACMAQSASAKEGWYGGPFALVGFTDHSNYDRTPLTPLPVTGTTDNAGVSGGAGLWGGYHFDGFSVEVAGTYRARHDANFSFADITSGNPNFGAKANVQTADLMISGLYDIPVGWKLMPYVGAGMGIAYKRLDNELLTNTITDAGSSRSTDVAWQLQGGVKYPLSESSNLRVDYRYIDLGQIETSALPTGTGDKLSADLVSHDVRIGLTWDF